MMSALPLLCCNQGKRTALGITSITKSCFQVDQSLDLQNFQTCPNEADLKLNDYSRKLVL